MFNQLKTVLLLGTLSAMLVGFGAALGRDLDDRRLGEGRDPEYRWLFLLRSHRPENATERSSWTSSSIRNCIRLQQSWLRRAGIPMPRLYLIPAHYPNAFATGRNPKHGVVAITEGLMQILNTRELRGVIAHEIAHIRNRDVLIATIAAMFAAAITYVANFLSFSSLFGSAKTRMRRRLWRPWRLRWWHR